jgi:hypothetical protein
MFPSTVLPSISYGLKELPLVERTGTGERGTPRLAQDFRYAADVILMPMGCNDQAHRRRVDSNTIQIAQRYWTSGLGIDTGIDADPFTGADMQEYTFPTARTEYR